METYLYPLLRNKQFIPRYVYDILNKSWYSFIFCIFFYWFECLPRIEDINGGFPRSRKANLHFFSSFEWIDYLIEDRGFIGFTVIGIWLPLTASNYFSLFSGFFGFSMQFGPSRQFDSTYRWSSLTKSPPSGRLGTLSYAPIKRKNTHNNKNKASHIKLDASN